MVYLHFTFARYKGQNLGHAYFDREYLINGDRYDKCCYRRCIGSRLLAFEWYLYIWLWSILNMKVEVKVEVIRKTIAKNSIM